MSENISISTPVKIESDSKARVALELMEKLAAKTGDDEQKKNKNYWLGLYCQCYKAANGRKLSEILKEE